MTQFCGSVYLHSRDFFSVLAVPFHVLLEQAILDAFRWLAFIFCCNISKPGSAVCEVMCARVGLSTTLRNRCPALLSVSTRLPFPPCIIHTACFSQSESALPIQIIGLVFYQKKHLVYVGPGVEFGWFIVLSSQNCLHPDVVMLLGPPLTSPHDGLHIDLAAWNWKGLNEAERFD